MNQPKICFLITLLLFFAIPQAQTKLSHVPRLYGKWILKTDPKYKITISKELIIEYYQGRKNADTFRCNISTSPCVPGKTPDNKTWFLQKEDKTGRYCFKLLSYSSNAFSLLAPDNKTYHFIRYLKRY